jgi:predicted RNA methylase
MAKLSKAQAKAHQQACDLLAKDALSEDDKWFVLENWQESANHVNSTAGAFFTPVGLARDFSIEVGGGRVIDLCAGIGTLSFMVMLRHCHGPLPQIVCIERNEAYAEVGRKILPEATWICANLFEVDLTALGHFDWAISNPPFGSVKRTKSAPRYSGKAFEYHVIDIASDIADLGAFIIPQEAASFRYSGEQCFEVKHSDAYKRFVEQTSIDLGPNCGLDTSAYLNDWHGVSPKTEIVIADFVEARAARMPAHQEPAPIPDDLFAAASIRNAA